MKVLVVDDVHTSRLSVELCLKKMEYEVVLASNGHQAYEIWQRDRPNFVVTDWNMPTMDGVQLCRKIRAEDGGRYTYIIVITSRKTVADLILAMEAGADDYIIKPFHRDELHVRIKAGERILNFQSKDLVIFSMAKLAESRDQHTGEHLERVRYYARYLAETMLTSRDRPPELDLSLIENIFLTSPLHDIGKVAIPDKILLKNGPLSHEEFDIMKTHAELGFRTLEEAMQKASGATYLEVAAEIAHHHHEKFNGTGYPDGLAGEEIPLASRIFALADVYDALVSKRPYKQPFSHEVARSIICEGRGTHFDPRVVDAFLRCESQFISVVTKYNGK